VNFKEWMHQEETVAFRKLLEGMQELILLEWASANYSNSDDLVISDSTRKGKLWGIEQVLDLMQVKPDSGEEVEDE